MMRMRHQGGLVLAMLIAGLGVQADTDVEFSGTLVSEPCQVATESEEQLVDFSNIASKTFIKHTRSAPKRFTIMLKECDLELGTQVSVTFLGEPDAIQPDTFAIQGQAKGIAIALEDENGKPVPPNQELTPVNLVEGDVPLNYVAYVQATDFEQVDFGDFMTTVTYALEYE